MSEMIRRQAMGSWERRRNEAMGRWGSLMRLLSKASVDTVTKMASAMEKYNKALSGSDDYEIARRAGVLERGIEVVEKEALDAGYAPNDMCWFDLGVRVEGKRAVAVMNSADAGYVASQLSKELDDAVVVYAASDIVLMAQEGQTLLHQLKHKADACTTIVNGGKLEEPTW